MRVDCSEKHFLGFVFIQFSPQQGCDIRNILEFCSSLATFENTRIREWLTDFSRKPWTTKKNRYFWVRDYGFPWATFMISFWWFPSQNGWLPHFRVTLWSHFEWLTENPWVLTDFPWATLWSLFKKQSVLNSLSAGVSKSEIGNLYHAITRVSKKPP